MRKLLEAMEIGAEGATETSIVVGTDSWEPSGEGIRDLNRRLSDCDHLVEVYYLDI